MRRTCCWCWSYDVSGEEHTQKLMGDSSFDAGDYKPPRTKLAANVPQFEDFRLRKMVGKGSFGKVFQAEHVAPKSVVAIKVILKSSVKTKREEARILAEAQILRRIDHPFCVSLLSSFQSDEHLFYVFPFLNGGMLFYHLKREMKFSENQSRFYIGEIILATEYLHSLGIIFRDLKPENVLLSSLGHVCLTDFGSAKDLEGSDQTSTFCGTPSYIAPEIIRGEQYGLSVDWWTCGVFLYEMLTGQAPFQARDRVQLYKKVLRSSITFPMYLSSNAVRLISQLLNKTPNQRLGHVYRSRTETATEIKSHAFFSQRDEKEEEEEDQDDEGRPSFIYNTWTWEELEALSVAPPFVPMIKSGFDVSNFDWSITSGPCTLPRSEDAVSRMSLFNRKLDDFDWTRN
ncbi:serine/threonine-protein kinase Sgk2-like [Oscarella lobularis]|uniref:serine/threonine-protein kinase Sgk2-like n=1 Tax=Oscarella lobularis TaxID=121494 RepID=UPI0033140586